MIGYLTLQGGRLTKTGNTLTFLKDQEKHVLFPDKVEQLFVLGSITVTPSARNTLLHHAIDTIFLTQYGNYLGRFASPEPANIFLRQQQFKRQEEASFKLISARSFIAGKCTNMATYLLRIARRKELNELEQSAQKIRTLLPKIENAVDLEQLRGFEGKAAAIYFGSFAHAFSEPHGFVARRRRPPPDPVNAVLSFLYTLLMNRVYAAVRRTNLDPYVGNLHSLSYGRYSLVLDLMEEWRTPVVDTLTVGLFNRNVLQAEDFVSEVPLPHEEQTLVSVTAGECFDSERAEIEAAISDPLGKFDTAEQTPCDLSIESQEEDVAPEAAAENAELPPDQRVYPVRMTPAALKRVIKAFEAKLQDEFVHPRLERRLSYAEALTAQASHYRQFVTGEIPHYTPVTLR